MRARTSKDLKTYRENSKIIISLGNSAVLECDFDMEGDQIYSVKWYKGNQTFYLEYKKMGILQKSTTNIQNEGH